MTGAQLEELRDQLNGYYVWDTRNPEGNGDKIGLPHRTREDAERWCEQVHIDLARVVIAPLPE